MRPLIPPPGPYVIPRDLSGPVAGVWIIQSLLALLSDQFSPSRVKPGSLTLAPDVILTAGSVAIGAGAPQ